MASAAASARRRLARLEQRQRSVRMIAVTSPDDLLPRDIAAMPGQTLLVVATGIYRNPITL